MIADKNLHKFAISRVTFNFDSDSSAGATDNLEHFEDQFSKIKIMQPEWITELAQ